MSPAQLREEIEFQTLYYLERYNNLTQKDIQPCQHKFDLKGRCAGMFCEHSDKKYFRWNTLLALENTDEYLKQTVGHEVAHFIVRTNEKANNKMRSKPHGTSWQVTMQILGLSADRCHSFKVTHNRPIECTCPCGYTSRLTIRKYKNMVKTIFNKTADTAYLCPKCRQYINALNCKNVNNS